MKPINEYLINKNTKEKGFELWTKKPYSLKTYWSLLNHIGDLKKEGYDDWEDRFGIYDCSDIFGSYDNLPKYQGTLVIRKIKVNNEGDLIPGIHLIKKQNNKAITVLDFVDDAEWTPLMQERKKIFDYIQDHLIDWEYEIKNTL